MHVLHNPSSLVFIYFLFLNDRKECYEMKVWHLNKTSNINFDQKIYTLYIPNITSKSYILWFFFKDFGFQIKTSWAVKNFTSNYLKKESCLQKCEYHVIHSGLQNYSGLLLHNVLHQCGMAWRWVASPLPLQRESFSVPSTKVYSNLPQLGHKYKTQ